MKHKNPFYALTLAAAVAFSLTACSYCVMILRRSAAASLATETDSGGLVQLMDRFGGLALGLLLILLAALSVAAMATDDYWLARAQRRARRNAANLPLPRPDNDAPAEP